MTTRHRSSGLCRTALGCPYMLGDWRFCEPVDDRKRWWVPGLGPRGSSDRGDGRRERYWRRDSAPARGGRGTCRARGSQVRAPRAERARPRGSGWPGPLRRGRPVRGREPRPRRARGGRTFRDGGRLGQQRCDRSSRAAAGVEGRGLRRARSRQRQGAVLPPARLAAVLAGIADPLGRQRELVVWDTATPRPVGLRDDEGGPELPDTIARG